MSDRRGLNYITEGFRWAWGWGLYEARTMRWLLIILLTAILLGVVVGIVLSLLADLTGWAVVGILLACLIVFVFLGVVLSRAVIPFVWEIMRTRGLEGRRG